MDLFRPSQEDRPVRRLVAAWPGVTEEVEGTRIQVFSAGDKMSCAMHDGADAQDLAFKVETAHFPEFTDRPGMIPAPFPARRHRISLTDAQALPDAGTRASIRRGDERVRGKLTRKVQREFAD
jgi:predicted DNA-binding protein (MmcQ/YjbR family)